MLRGFYRIKTNYIASALIVNAFSGLLFGTTLTLQKEVQWMLG
jgi:hypothetical protein